MDTLSTQSYIAKTPVFEGPLEVLLEMIEKRKLFINEISLASVSEDYVLYVKSLGDNSNEKILDITGFISVAATLILIKSRSLLPNLILAPEEEQDIDILEKRLKLYQKVQEIGMILKDRFGVQTSFVRTESQDIGPVWSPDPQITLTSMLSSLHAVLQALPKKEILPEVSVKKVITIEEMMVSLEERIKTAVSTSFKAFTQNSAIEPKEQKVNFIISFLALLELVRSGIADVVQNRQFDDMMITKQDSLENIEE